MARTITRAALQEAIEAGISAGNAFAPDEIEALRLVGRTATKVARGAYSVGDCGCPATQAGIVPAEHEPCDSPAWEAIERFTTAFDDTTRDAEWTIVLIVID